MTPRMKPTGLLLLLCLLPVLATAGGGPENVLLVVNDASPESLEVAHYYMQRRGIPRHQIVHLRLTKKTQWQTIRPFSLYQTKIEQPIKAWLAAHPKNAITTIVLARHVPLVVELERPDPMPKKLRDRQRSLAHMLAIMQVAQPRLRRMSNTWRQSPNPYNGADRSIDPRDPLTPRGQPFPLYCVNTLNAFSVADVKRMIDRAIEADGKRPTGTVYLGRSRAKDPRGCYNGDFPNLQRTLTAAGFKVEQIPHPGKSSALLVDKQDVLVYQFGQARWDKAFPARNRYAPGALVDNLTSVALTERSFRLKPRGQTSMCHFLAAGATAVHGCVREPYTIAFNGRHTHIQRYLAGYNLIESYYMAHPIMPWMNLVAGDPLTQPFAQRPLVTLAQPADGKLLASARATRKGAKIAQLTLYLDGRQLQQLPGPKATFAIEGIDASVHTLVVVATDDSRYRAQGRAVLQPAFVVDASADEIRFERFESGKAHFRISRKPVLYRWYAPGAKPQSGMARGSTLALSIGAAARNTIEIWIHTDPTQAPVVKFIELDSVMRDHAMRAAKQAHSSGDLLALADALRLLTGSDLSAAQKTQVAGWQTALDQRLSSQWQRLDKGKDLQRIGAFAKRYVAFAVGKLARQKLVELRAEADALALPFWTAAEQLCKGEQWYEALGKYRELRRRYPGSKYARPAGERVKQILANPAAQQALTAARRVKAAERLYRMASAYKSNGMTALWKKHLTKLIAQYPETEQAKQAKADLGQD